MAKYFQTATGYIEADDDQAAQPGWTEITQAQYDALVASHQAVMNQAVADEKAAANQRWTTVHDDLVASGVTEAAATIIANAVGFKPDID